MTRASILALVAACGGSSAGSDANGGGGPDGPPPAHTGGAGLTVYKATSASGPVVGTSAYAQFNSSAPQCTTSHRMGTCYLQQCTTAVTAVSAGAITITGGSQAIDLTPGTGGT